MTHWQRALWGADLGACFLSLTSMNFLPPSSNTFSRTSVGRTNPLCPHFFVCSYCHTFNRSPVTCEPAAFGLAVRCSLAVAMPVLLGYVFLPQLSTLTLSGSEAPQLAALPFKLNHCWCIFAHVPGCELRQVRRGRGPALMCCFGGSAPPPAAETLLLCIAAVKWESP